MCTFNTTNVHASLALTAVDVSSVTNVTLNDRTSVKTANVRMYWKRVLDALLEVGERVEKVETTSAQNTVKVGQRKAEVVSVARAVSGKYPTELFFSADQTGYTSGRFCLVETACPRVLAHDGLQRFPYRFSLHVLSKLDTEKYSQFL